MSLETLAIARNASVILLALECLVLGALPLAILYIATRFLRRLLREARPFLSKATESVHRLLGHVDSGLSMVARPFIWLNARHAAWSAFWQRIRG
ncbi:MAG: hypothetical protein H5T69_10695 [Chloroflexi bacterium]|nr:hypothetical protein [Chloroflexota bacterium]